MKFINMLKISNDVVVVIVTFNSQNNIYNLLESLINQTYKSLSILIIDNASIDNTCNIVKDFIDKYSQKEIIFYELGYNSGGAGGFYYGLKFAYEQGATYIFTIDDDAYLDNNNYIENMLSFKHGRVGDLDVVAPLVIDSENKNLAAYEYKLGDAKLVEIYDICSHYLHKEIKDIKLFNGVLFDRKVIDKIGLPKKEFFIRGDEQEYKSRIMQTDLSVAVNINCKVFHPSSLSEYYYIRGNRYHHLDSPFKLYYSTRNRFYMIKIRKDWGVLKKIRYVFNEVRKYSYFYLIHRKLDILNYFLWIKSATLGLIGYMNNIK